MPRWVYVLAYVGAIALAVLFCVCARASEPVLGTVYLSRNLDERSNTTPGAWNHLAIFAGNGKVVEAQDGQGVIETPLEEYLARPYVVARIYPRDPSIGAKAAEIAKTYVGRPYHWSSSITPNITPTYGKNCVSPVTEAYARAAGRQVRRTRRPDHILRLPQLFTNQNPAEVPEAPPLEVTP